MTRQIPTSLREFSRAGFLLRVWWSVRPRALERAQQLGVMPEIEARLRTGHQISRTWLFAFAVAFGITLVDGAWLGSSHLFTFNDALQLLLLVVGQVGGLYALRRSNETRAYLHRVQEIVQDLATHAAFASVLARERQTSCATIEELRLQALVTLEALKHSILFPHVDAFSLWARDDACESWRMVAGIGPSAHSLRCFTQPILASEEPGAGVVANLAAVGQGEYYQPRPGECVVGDPRWFAHNPLTDAPAVTVAVFLLPDERGMPIGAFALTSRDDDALSCERLSDFPREVRLILSHCTVSLGGLSRRAAELWSKTGRHTR